MGIPETGLTVFAPVYNEEALVKENTERLFQFLTSLGGGPFEILVGSNGSTDKTVPLLAGIAAENPAVRFFELPEKGVGKAFRKAVEMARYPKIVTVDMDLSIDLAFVPRAADLLQTHDMVIGSKVMGGQKRPFMRVFVSNLFITLARFLLGISFHDYSIAAKGYRTPMAEKYLPRLDDQTFYVVTVAHRAVKDGFSVTEIPVSCHDMRGSRFNLLHEGLYKFGNLFLLAYKTLLGKLTGYGKGQPR